ncbi:hypothetical protein IQ249_24870 [Lusitaniella coriacea LEGE 07157]|uniref:Uncharacterized protein n=1 Tax=Lusitaniella coriacea LEGE 07157 TaxID=945747 RepID=A0A8J7E0E4_9CYAN|nr:hypothetical protein [Lusitaniella coriacea]MBE9119094.1 hypothetical protein [Lusitaniella coriacea LEGE 07157]
MNYQKFSSFEFENALEDKEDIKKKSFSLEQKIIKEIDKVVQIEFRKIVEELNRNGHDLKPYRQFLPFPTKGDAQYRDDCGDEIDYQCKLRIGFNFVISVGYSDTQS